MPKDIIILHKCTKNYEHMLYCSWGMTCDTCNCHFFHFGLFFALLTPWQPKNSKLKKTKKLRYIIILHKCTKNHDHMLYCSWDKACGRCKCYFAFWTDFCPFTPPWQFKKSKFKKQIKKRKKTKKIPGEIIILCMGTKHNYQKMYGSWDIVHNRWVDRQMEGQTDGWTENVDI